MSRPSVAFLQKENSEQKAIMQEQETTINQQRTEIMDLRSRLAQQRGMARNLKKQRER